MNSTVDGKKEIHTNEKTQVTTTTNIIMTDPINDILIVINRSKTNENIKST